MTRKRDLKKRIRDRQAKTGESYTTSRRHVLAGRNTDGDEGEGPTPPDSSDIATVDDAKASRPLITKPGPTGDRFSDELDAVRARESSDELEATNPGIAVPKRDGGAIELIDKADPAFAVPESNRGPIELAKRQHERSEAMHNAWKLETNTDAPKTAELRKLLEPKQPIEVDELIDVTSVAKGLGFGCKVLVYPRLTKAAQTPVVLAAIRNALDATKSDPVTQLLRAVVAGQAQMLRIAPTRERVLRDPEFMAKIAAGLTAVSKDGRMLALHVNGYAGMVTVVCAAWRKANTLTITTPDDRLGPVLAGIYGPSESLFLVYEGRRYKIGRNPFVVGRHPTCNLQIRDGHVSRKHVAIVYRHGNYYIFDLGSHAGIEYKGLKISNKRIEEGDMFKLHEYALRFTFHETDA